MAHDERRPLRSQSWWDAGALDLIGHRSQFRMQGFPEEAFTGRPVIGILNSWSEVAGCNAHLRELADHVKRGVLSAGGFPVEVPVISLGEPIIKPTAMLYRNLMAMAVEELIRGNPLDGVVLLASCDKTVPAALMGAASVDVPALMVTGGPMLSGRFRNEHVGACTDCWRLNDELRGDRITQADWDEFESGMCRSFGHCSPMGTASTMACMTEALGMAPSGSAAIPAVDSRRRHVAERAGVPDHGSRRGRYTAVGHHDPRRVRERHPHAPRDRRLDQRRHPSHGHRRPARRRKSRLSSSTSSRPRRRCW